MIKGIRKFCYRTLRKMRWLPPKAYAKYHYGYHTGKKLNLDDPKEFNEKIQWLKVFYHPNKLTQLADKYAVRSYVEEKIGAQYLNEIYGVFEKPEDVPFESLPNQFVIKATHTSSFNLIVDDKSRLNKKKALNSFKKWLSINQYYRMGQEWAYKNIKPRLIVEKFLKEDGKDSLIDYKFYCFNGDAKFIDVHLDRENDHKQGCFDLNFNLLPFDKSSKFKTIGGKIEKPTNLEEMINLAEALADNLPFVRVDFYSVNGKSVFGEMTFYPGDGRKDFIPDKYNRIIGDYMKLPKLKKGQKKITELT